MLVAYKKSSIICQHENYILAKASVKILSAAKTANISGVNMNCIAVRNIARQKISAILSSPETEDISSDKIADILQNNSMFPNEQILFKECK